MHSRVPSAKSAGSSRSSSIRRRGKWSTATYEIELARERDEATVPVTYVELSEDEERLVLACLDPIGAMASEHGLEAIKAGHGDADAVGGLPVEPTVMPGELYALGDHRLLCGDATDPGQVRRAFGVDEHADLIWTDPPYGVAYQTKLSVEEAVARHRRTDGLEISNERRRGPCLLRDPRGRRDARPPAADLGQGCVRHGAP